MDTVAILKLAKLLDKVDEYNPKLFNMGKWGADEGGPAYTSNDPDKPHDLKCSSAGCIAGWAVSFFASKDAIEELFWRDQRPDVLGAEILDLDRYQRDDLFEPEDSFYYRATAGQAAKVLRHLASTGEVDWTASGIEG